MEIKPISTWTKDDLERLRDDPYNLEDMNIEYKVQYSGDGDELRKDIVSFTNSELGGYILFGIKDDPFELIGLTRGEVDKLKNTIENIITSNIDPHLEPKPVLNPIILSKGLYILGVQIFPKQIGLYAIRKVNNPNNPDFCFYSFWVRSDGCKRQLSMEEVNSYIMNTNPYKRDIEVTIKINWNPRRPTNSDYDRLSGEEIRDLFHSHPVIGDFPKYLIIHGVNKSMRPIIVKDDQFLLYDKNNNEWIRIFPRSKIIDPITIYNTPRDTDIKLKETESCSWHYPLEELKAGIEYLKLEYPIRIKGLISTEDKEFYSEEILLS